MIKSIDLTGPMLLYSSRCCSLPPSSIDVQFIIHMDIYDFFPPTLPSFLLYGSPPEVLSIRRLILRHIDLAFSKIIWVLASPLFIMSKLCRPRQCGSLFFDRAGHPFHHFVIDHIMFAVLEAQYAAGRNNFDRFILVFFRYSGHVVMQAGYAK